MKLRHRKAQDKGQAKRKLLPWFLAVLLCLSVLSGLLIARAATGIDVNDPDVGPSSGWQVYNPMNGDFDTVEDPRTGNGSTSRDIVGDATYPAVYIQFYEDGENSEIAVRVRVNNCDGTASNPLFRNFVFIGVDANLNGTIDFFIGCYDPSGNGRLGVYLADPSAANDGPNTTSITKPVLAQPPVQGVNYSMIPVEDGSFFSGDTDYFITFKFKLEDVRGAILGKTKEAVDFTPDTPFTFFTGTSTQDNAFNSDINGIDDQNPPPKGSTWTDIGVLTPPVSVAGIEWVTVTFDRNTGDRDASPTQMTVEEGTSTGSLPIPPRKAGHYFIGWNTEASGTGDRFYANTVVTEDITVYAMWTTDPPADPPETVHFDANGGSWSGTTEDHRDSIDGMVGVSNMPPAPTTTPTVQGSTVVFGGWTTEKYNILTLNTSNGEIDILTWNRMVSELTKVQYDHGEEYTVYALWLAVANTNSAKADFYDNWNPSPPGSLLYSIYAHSSGQLGYVPKHPTREGYVFVGWATNPQGTGTIYDAPGGANPLSAVSLDNKLSGWNNSTKTATFYAQWVPAKYAIQFNPNTADTLGRPLAGDPTGVPVPQLCASSLYVVPSGDPVLPGYTFLGWNTQPDGYGIYIQDSDPLRYRLMVDITSSDPPELQVISGQAITSYTPVYAIWERDPIPPVTVHFNPMGGAFPNGSTAILDVPADDGSLDYYPAPPEWRDGEGNILYTFLGWSYDSGIGRQVNANLFTDVFDQEVTLYAVWENIYVVTFFPNGGGWWWLTGEDALKPIKVPTASGQVMYMPWNPDRSPYAFVEWNTLSNGTGDLFTINTYVDRDMYVYAQYEPPNPGDIMVIFDLNDGTGELLPDPNGDYTVPQGSIVSAPLPPPEREDYLFGGWHTEPGCETEWDFADPFQVTTTLYALWIPDTSVRVPFSFFKVSATDLITPLPGAVFGLFKRNSYEEAAQGHVHDALYSQGSPCWLPVGEQVTSGLDGLVDFGTLPEGAYLLVELKAPDEYARPKGQWEIVLDAGAQEPVGITGIGKPLPPAFIQGSPRKLPNISPIIMPFTGSAGRLAFTITGVVCMTAALMLFAAYTFTKRKSRKIVY